MSSELYEDDLFSIMSGKSKSIAEGLKRKVENDCADIFINADNTTNNTGPDGVALSSASHPREDGGTAQSNRATTALSETSLEAALVAMSETLDGKGQKIMLKPNLLVVPVELEVEARVLIESTGRTQTTYLNDINPFQGRLEVFAYNWLTDATNCFKYLTGWSKILFNYLEPDKATRGKLLCYE